jgi:3-deoxy-7-phosphoheptulonate synthase
MLIELKSDTTEQEEMVLIKRLTKMGFHVKKSSERKFAIVKGMTSQVQYQEYERLPGVQKVTLSSTPYILASRQFKSSDTIIQVKGKQIGGGSCFIAGGPCSIESEEQMDACAKVVKEKGAQGLRGGAFKPRTSHYEFQGLKEEGLEIIQKIGNRYGLVTISEVMEISQIPLIAHYVDILQVGARNMQNFDLLRELGKLQCPILLKRGFSATYKDLLMAAEYILSEGNPNVVLCERGIRTFETHTRNTLDLNAVPILKGLTHLPVMVDPSHGTGIRSIVAPMAKASLVAGADALMMEIHPDPDRAISDAQQTLSLESFAQLMDELRKLESCCRT